MENASLVALSRQIVLKRELEMTANNVANMNTLGFKRELLNMAAVPSGTSSTLGFPRGDRIDTFVADWTSTTDMDQGAIQTTGNPTDVAINGAAYFAIQTPRGERYTRAGNFTINAQGQLVTQGGDPVAGTSGPISIPPGETELSISQDGTVSTASGVKGKIRTVTFANPRLLSKEGLNLFNGQNPQVATNPQLVQGAIESSNVKPVEEMTRMIDVTRSYEMLANIMKSHEDMRNKAVDQLGKLSA